MQNAHLSHKPGKINLTASCHNRNLDEEGFVLPPRTRARACHATALGPHVQVSRHSSGHLPVLVEAEIKGNQLVSRPPGLTYNALRPGRCPKLGTYNVTGGYRIALVEMTLRHRYLGNLFACWTPNVFGFLELPALEVLSLHHILLVLLDLPHLIFEGISQDAIKEFTISSPTLKSLAIYMFGVTNHNIEASLSSLIIQETLTSANIPLPKLETLSLVYERYEHEDISETKGRDT
ncbi:hypothetical protein BDN72DRAFT_854875 [Pluteus cervinus]|uniref:Uncharacterized protein n=1 Tax=Pluteus cervinus TaxID=181527 RepID=A0ACD3B894_9AGAR|nr:hypothetical protein BDN72DRAFT_854875 [Pluteus cervinus]